MFLTLVLIVLFLANKGFFANFMAQIKTTGNCPTGVDAADQVNQAALAATAAAPGAGYGLTLPPLNPGQQVPDPVAIGPM